MKVVGVSFDNNQTRKQFFKRLFGDASGYVCLATRRMTSKHLQEEFFKYPEHMDSILEWVNRNFHGKNLYFCPQLLSEKKRIKANVKVCTNVWSDLDECKPSLVQPEPSITLETSPGRYQAFWILDKPADPLDAEDASHRIAYKYSPYGADKTGWDLTQLLRIPLTYNTKYERPGEIPVVQILKTTEETYPLQTFMEIDPVPGFEVSDEPLPQGLIEADPDEILENYRVKLDARVHELYNNVPRDDWSTALWHLEMLLLEAGLTKEETFTVCWHAKCNKFQRDGREPTHLWRDVLRASSRISVRMEEFSVGAKLKPLLTDEERELVTKLNDTFVERYVTWARTRGDAAWQYHEAGAFTILSTILSGVIRLNTSFGTIVPNMWFMLLADTTLTRKTTAMDMAMELLLLVEPDAVLATDGSLEGLLTAISNRPNIPSIFWRDEFSGLLDAIKKKDYLAGMLETLTKLYDGKYQKRILRKDTIEIRDPILLIFCGGIRTNILQSAEYEHIISGFIPRFIFVSAESDIANYQPVGPMTEEHDSRMEVLQKELSEMKNRFTGEMTVHIGEQTITTPQLWEAKLTSEAWTRYNQLERTMVEMGVESSSPETYTPTFDRLAKSGLKAACLIAASYQNPTEKGHILVEVKDILHAASYIERWMEHSSDVIANTGKTATEKRIDAVFKAIVKSPGITRSRIMQNHHLTAREADWVFETLDQRGLVRRAKNGRTEFLHPTVAG